MYRRFRGCWNIFAWLVTLLPVFCSTTCDEVQGLAQSDGSSIRRCIAWNWSTKEHSNDHGNCSCSADICRYVLVSVQVVNLASSTRTIPLYMQCTAANRNWRKPEASGLQSNTEWVLLPLWGPPKMCNYILQPGVLQIWAINLVSSRVVTKGCPDVDRATL